MQIKTAELEGAALDWAVAVSVKAEPVLPRHNGIFGFYVNSCPPCMLSAVPADGSRFRPSIDWSQGGPLISKYRVEFYDQQDKYTAIIAKEDDARCFECGCVIEPCISGKTHLIAAMRAIVAAEIGETVDIPKELL